MFTLSGRNTSIGRIGRAVSVAGLVSVLAGGCATDTPLAPDPIEPSRAAATSSPEAAETWNQSRPVGFTTLEKEQFGPYWASGMYLITSVKDWDACMAKLIEEGTLFEQPAPAAPEVDWKREGVILITMGVRPTTCYDLEIRSVRRHGSTVLVDVEWSRPKLGGRYCYQTYITPYHLVRIDRHPSMKRIREI